MAYSPVSQIVACGCGNSVIRLWSIVSPSLPVETEFRDHIQIISKISQPQHKKEMLEHSEQGQRNQAGEIHRDNQKSKKTQQPELEIKKGRKQTQEEKQEKAKKTTTTTT